MVELASRKKSEANKADDYLADFKKKVKEEQVELETFLEDKAHEVYVFPLPMSFHCKSLNRGVSSRLIFDIP